ncbi:MAG TPA: heme ABC exporter ATP-binding protein CcmA [Actinomycetota bacterium]|nr:heme ABC exporter ATP-binding protein CcmA [Actinomycetota bacterium]
MDGRPALGIALTQVSKAFGAQLALDHVDLTIDQGSFVAVMGANGAGKTTLLKVISGLAAPTSGSVRIAGIEMRKAGPKLRALVGVVSHETMLYADLTTEENLRFHAKLFGLRDPAAAVMRAVERLDVAHVLDKPVRALSRGTRQRVALARALLHDPAVILLDEPYTGLDEAAAATLTELLDELATPGRILMLTLHDVVRALSGPRRLIVLSGGRVALDEPIAGSTDRMAETYLGLLRAEARR